MATEITEIERLLGYARHLLTAPGRVVTMQAWRDEIALPDGPNGERRIRKGKLSVLFEAVNEGDARPESPIKHRDFVFDGEVFRISRGEDGSVSLAGDWITLAAALHTLWAVAEDRDRLQELLGKAEAERERQAAGWKQSASAHLETAIKAEAAEAKAKRRKAKIRRLKEELRRANNALIDANEHRLRLAAEIRVAKEPSRLDGPVVAEGQAFTIEEGADKPHGDGVYVGLDVRTGLRLCGWPGRHLDLRGLASTAEEVGKLAESRPLQEGEDVTFEEVHAVVSDRGGHLGFVFRECEIERLLAAGGRWC